MAAQTFLIPYRPAFNSNGLAVPGAVARFYEPGTLTPKQVFSNSALTTPYGSSVTANGAGRFPTVYLDDTETYRVIIEDSEGVELDDLDDYVPGVLYGVTQADAFADAAEDARDEARAWFIAARGLFRGLSVPNDARAVDLLEDHTEGFALDATTEDIAHAVYVKDGTTPANDFDGSIEDYFTTLTWPARSVVNEAGETVTTTLGDVPYDWSRGGRRLKITFADIFRIQTDVLPSPRTLLIQGQFEYIGAGGDASLFGLVADGANPHFWTMSVIGGDDPLPYLSSSLREEHSYVEGVAYGQYCGAIPDLAADDESLSIAGSWTDTHFYISVNGEPTGIDARVTSVPSLDDATLEIRDANAVFYLERIIILPDSLTPTELSNWQNAAARHPYVVCSLTMGRESDTADTNRERMPTILKLGEFGDKAYLLGFHHQRASGNEDDPELPIRVMQMHAAFDRSTETIVGETARSTASLTPVGWGNTPPVGWEASPLSIKLTYGPYQGRILQWFERLVNASGEFDETYDQDIMFRYSDDNGHTWSTPSTSLDGSALFGGLIYSGVAGRPILFPADSDYPNRVVFPFYQYPSEAVRLAYTDDWGVTMAYSNSVAAGSETTIALRPNGTIVGTSRVAAVNTRKFFHSNNGGQTLVLDGNMPDYVGAIGAGSAVSLDDNGVFGTLGRWSLVRADNSYLSKDGIRFTAYENAALTPLDETHLLARMREYFYSDLVPLFGGVYGALVVENHILTPNQSASSHIVIVRLPA